MSALTAAVVLAWGCLAVLTLAMAGMLRQVRELQTELTQLRAGLETQPWRATVGRRLPALAGQGHLVLLVLDPGCGLCDAVREPFTRLAGEHPGARFEVLSPRVPQAHQHWAEAPNTRSWVDPELVAELDLPWAPALLHAGDDGTVFAAQPVVSPERIGEQAASLLNAATARQGA
ncbi:MAG: hypothetical protein QOG46_820 [Pseudonocardiales bacterium]|nr:hypothetical protein [Pseudonocardiales bacterium]